MPASKAQQRAVAKYMAANYDELKVRIPKGRKADIEARAKSTGSGSINGYIGGLIRADLGLSEADWKRGEESDG